MPDHVYDSSKREGHACGEPCNVCDGGLSVCVVCLSCEGGLTTECPGEPVDMKRVSLVYTGQLDFVDGAWRARASEHSPDGARQMAGLLSGYFKEVEGAKDTDGLISTWIEWRCDIKKFSAGARRGCWDSLCRRAEELGQKLPKVWMKLGVEAEVAKRQRESTDRMKLEAKDEYPE